MLDEISKGQVEKIETQMRLTKLEDRGHLNHVRLQKVLPFAGIDQNLQNIAPGVVGARAAWTQFQQPPTPPRPTLPRSGERRAVQAATYRAALTNDMPR